MSTLTYLDGQGNVTYVVASLNEEGGFIQPPVEATDDVHFQTLLVPTHFVTRSRVVIAEAMQVVKKGEMVPAPTNGRAILRSALARCDTNLGMRVGARLTFYTESDVIGGLKALIGEGAHLAIVSYSKLSGSDEGWVVDLADASPLVMADALALIHHSLTFREMHYRFSFATIQTIQGAYDLEPDAWMDCLFPGQHPRSIAKMQGRGACWDSASQPYLVPDATYKLLANQITKIWGICQELIGADEGEEVKDGGGEETRVDAGGEETRVDAGGEETRVDAGGEETRVDAGGEETRVDAGGEETRVDAGGEETRVDAGGGEEPGNEPAFISKEGEGGGEN